MEQQQMENDLSEMSYLTKIRELARQGPEALERFEKTQEYEAKIAWHENEIARCEYAIKLIESGKDPEREMEREMKQQMEDADF